MRNNFFCVLLTAWLLTSLPQTHSVHSGSHTFHASFLERLKATTHVQHYVFPLLKTYDNIVPEQEHILDISSDNGDRVMIEVLSFRTESCCARLVLTSGTLQTTWRGIVAKSTRFSGAPSNHVQLRFTTRNSMMIPDIGLAYYIAPKEVDPRCPSPPPAREGIFGTCVQECGTGVEDKCPSGKICCSNACGNICIDETGFGIKKAKFNPTFAPVFGIKKATFTPTTSKTTSTTTDADSNVERLRLMHTIIEASVGTIFGVIFLIGLAIFVRRSERTKRELSCNCTSWSCTYASSNSVEPSDHETRTSEPELSKSRN